MPFATTCLDLEGIMLGKISQTKKYKYHMILLIYGIYKTNQTQQNRKYSHRYNEQTSGHRVAAEVRRTGETDKGD